MFRNYYNSLLILIVISLIFFSSTTHTQAKDGASAGAAMTQTATTFLESLSKQQRAQARFEYSSPKRTDWHYIPKHERKGIQLKNMTLTQQELAKSILKHALSPEGYEKAEDIMDIENILHLFDKNTKHIRDPLRYFWTIFGTPTLDETWGLSVEGHHLSFNFVVEKGVLVNATPIFFGANPSIIYKNKGVGPKIGKRPLHAEENLAFELISSLTEKQKKIAVTLEKSPRDMKEGGLAQTENTPPTGISSEKLNSNQKALLSSLIRTHINNLSQEAAQPMLKKIESESAIRFAWHGATEPGTGHSYHIQGATFLIQFYNTQKASTGEPANHAHTILRTIGKDFHLTGN